MKKRILLATLVMTAAACGKDANPAAPERVAGPARTNSGYFGSGNRAESDSVASGPSETDPSRNGGYFGSGNLVEPAPEDGGR
jgi:hypothetical protein